jgi:hypothetical protein
MVPVLALGIALAPTGQMEVQAKTASKKTVAAAYKKLLTSSSTLTESYLGTTDLSKLEFAVFDINGDGVKELYLTGDDGYHANIYTYYKGKVKQIDSAFSGKYIYYRNANLVYSDTYHSSFDKSYSKLKNGKMVTLASAEGEITFDENDNQVITYSKYTVKGKTTTKAKYNAYVKKLKSGKTKGKLKLYKNTQKNRNKYL